MMRRSLSEDVRAPPAWSPSPSPTLTRSFSEITLSRPPNRAPVVAAAKTIRTATRVITPSTSIRFGAIDENSMGAGDDTLPYDDDSML